MNLQRSDDELWFEAQQIEAARMDETERAQNPFAAVLGLAGIVATIALIFLLWRIFETFITIVRYGVDHASFLFSMGHLIRWLGKAAFEPYAEALIALMGVTICIVAYRSLSRAHLAIEAFTWRRRA